MATGIPIWLDCDTGHDDAFAMLLAAHHPRANLLGISTVFGNASLSHTTYNTLAILKAIGKEKVPVYPGASRPFCREVAHAEDIHGETGLDGTTCLPVPSEQARGDITAIAAMYKALSQCAKGTAWVVATGSLTNVALLFAVHPDLVDHIAGLSIMGGAVGNNFTSAILGTVKGQGTRFGNWTPWAEFNIYIDPESASAVFSNQKLAQKSTLITLDLTHQFLATDKIQRLISHGSQHQSDAISTAISPTRKLFLEILNFFAKTYADVFGLKDGPPLHDPLAVVAALAPVLFDDGAQDYFDVTVVIDGAHGSSLEIRDGESQCGRTIVKKSQGRGVRVPRSTKQDQIWAMIDDALAEAEAQQ